MSSQYPTVRDSTGNQTVWCEVVLSGVTTSDCDEFYGSVRTVSDLGIFGDTSEISSGCLALGAIIADARIMIFAGFGVIICLIRR